MRKKESVLRKFLDDCNKRRLVYVELSERTLKAMPTPSTEHALYCLCRELVELEAIMLMGL